MDANELVVEDAGAKEGVNISPFWTGEPLKEFIDQKWDIEWSWWAEGDLVGLSIADHDLDTTVETGFGVVKKSFDCQSVHLHEDMFGKCDIGL